jgi:hypothetical protein
MFAMNLDKYYILDYGNASEETGSQFPQVQRMGKGYDYDAHASIHNLGTDMLEFTPKIQT